MSDLKKRQELSEDVVEVVNGGVRLIYSDAKVNLKDKLQESINEKLKMDAQKSGKLK